VSLYGEVQKEVVQATLADEFGLDVGFRETTTICVERPVGSGAAVEFNGREPNPFLATVGLRVDPAPVGSGVEFGLEVELGAMPYAFFKAVEDTVKETLDQGIHGWRVTDCTVTMTHSGYSPRQSHAHQGFDKSMSSTGADFRGLTPLVLMEALRQAGTQVYEPMHRFRMEAPADTLGALLPVLARLRAVPRTTETRGTSCVLEGAIPAAQVNEPFPGVLPAATFGFKRVALNVTYMPESIVDRVTNSKRHDPTLEGVFFLQLKLDASLFGLGRGSERQWLAQGRAD
jgi:ribosomal protection tetracycline resistance protein